LAVGDKIFVVVADSQIQAQYTIEAPVDRALVRRMEENLSWKCTCGTPELFGRLATYEAHVKNECPDRLLSCRWCSAHKDKASLVVAHEQECPQREVTCPLCSLKMLFSDADQHKGTAVSVATADGTPGCKGVSWCNQCSTWQVGTTQEAVAAHSKACPRQLVKCDDCDLECVRACIDSHRETDVLCLRKQLAKFKIQLADTTAAAAATAAATAAAAVGKLTDSIGTRPKRRVTAASFSSMKLLKKPAIGMKVVCCSRYVNSEWFLGEIVYKHSCERWSVCYDGMQFTNATHDVLYPLSSLGDPSTVDFEVVAPLP